MAAATVANWQRESFKSSMASSMISDYNAVNLIPKKPKTFFQQRYQTERQRTETALDPWTRAWLLFAAQQHVNTLQESGEGISNSSNCISRVEKRNRNSSEDVQNEALDLSMETLRKRSRRVINKQQIEASSNQTRDFYEEVNSKNDEEFAILGNQLTNEMNVSHQEHDCMQKEDDENVAIPKFDREQKKKKREIGIAHQIVPEYLKCPCCDYKSTSTSNFSHHVRNHHHATKRYQCEICKKEFNHSDNLRSHAKIHYRTALPYKCNVCGHGFVREQTKYVHERQCNRMVYGCVKCKYQTDSLNQFLQHFKITQCHL